MNDATSIGEQRVRSIVPAVERAVRILQIVADRPAGRSFREIQEISAIPRSTCHLLIDTLIALRALEASERKLYRQGPLLFELGAAYQHGNDIVRCFSRHAKSLTSVTGETVQCSILDKRDILYIAMEEGHHPIRLASRVGARLPAYATAMGKVLLAALPTHQLRDHLPSEPFPALSPKTVVNTVALSLELRTVREQGYAIDNEGVMTGLCCVAAPICQGTGTVVASLSVSLFTDRFMQIGEEALSVAVTSAAESISRELGYSGTREARAMG